MPKNLSTDSLSLKEALEYYENGKHRRYSLLFAVNGGAFAIARLLTGEQGKSGLVLGDLSLRELAAGMALLTCFMVWDIFVFGESVRANFLDTAFQKQGKTVLFVLGALIFVGWLLVGGVARGA